MALFNVRLEADLAARFDVWAASRGGRSGALRSLMTEACAAERACDGEGPRRALRPMKLTVRLSAADAANLACQAREMGLSPNAWAAAVLRRRLTGKPTLPPAQTVAVIAIQAELRRIGVNVNQIARALNVAVMEGKVLDLEIAALDDLKGELAAHMRALREAFEGNLACWLDAP